MNQSIINISIPLDGVLASPLSGCRLVSCSVGLVDVGDFGYEWIVRVRICEHGANGEEDCVFVSEAVEKFKRERSAYPLRSSRLATIDHAGCLSRWNRWS